MTCERCGRLAVEGAPLCTAHVGEMAARREARRHRYGVIELLGLQLRHYTRALGERDALVEGAS